MRLLPLVVAAVVAVLLPLASPADAMVFIFDWTLRTTDRSLSGSDTATLTPSTVSPTSLDAFPGSKVYQLAFGSGYGGLVVDPSWSAGRLNLPQVGNVGNWLFSSFHLTDAGFSLDFVFKAIGPSADIPIIVGELAGTGRPIAQAVEPETLGFAALGLAGLVLLRRARRKHRA